MNELVKLGFMRAAGEIYRHTPGLLMPLLGNSVGRGLGYITPVMDKKVKEKKKEINAKYDKKSINAKKRFSEEHYAKYEKRMATLRAKALKGAKQSVRDSQSATGGQVGLTIGLLGMLGQPAARGGSYNSGRSGGYRRSGSGGGFAGPGTSRRDISKAKDYFSVNGLKTKKEVKKAIHAKVKKHHPDLGGTEEEMKRVNKLKEQVEKSDWFSKLAFLNKVRGF